MLMLKSRESRGRRGSQGRQNRKTKYEFVERPRTWDESKAKEKADIAWLDDWARKKSKVEQG